MNIIDIETHRRSINAIKQRLIESVTAKAAKEKISPITRELPKEWEEVLEMAFLLPSLLEVLENCKDGLKKYVLPADDDLETAGMTESEILVYEQMRREVAFAEHMLSIVRNRRKGKRGGPGA